MCYEFMALANRIGIISGRYMRAMFTRRPDLSPQGSADAIQIHSTICRICYVNIGLKSMLRDLPKMGILQKDHDHGYIDP
jgi:hypothetical protein